MIRKFLYASMVCCLTAVSATGTEGYLGVSVRSLGEVTGAGIRLAYVYDDGAARVAGLHENDIIVSVNGTLVHHTVQFRQLLAPYDWGDAVTIGYIRDGKPGSVRVTLGHAPSRKTYEILKSEQLTGETLWYFNDNTTVVLAGETPVSITNKVHGAKETLEIRPDMDWNQLPARFMDLPDKLDMIAYTLEEQRLRGEDADRITFIQELEGLEERQQAPMSLETTVFEVFPNPSSGHFTVRVESAAEGPLSWDVFDLRGSSVASGEGGLFRGAFEASIHLPEGLSGMHLLYIRIGGEKLTQQLMLQ